MDTPNANAPLQLPANELQAQLDALRHLFVSLTILVIVVTLTFALCLARLDRSVRQDLAVIRPQAAQLFAEHQKLNGSYDDFVKKITEYGRTHQDFAPILVKYGLKPNAPTTSPGSLSPASLPPVTAPKK